MKQCSFLECNKCHYARGFCKNHYHLVRRKGFQISIDEWKELKKRVKCIIEGCNSISRRLKYCGKHYAKLLKYGDPLVIKQEQNHNRSPKCTVDDCNNKHYGLGYCHNHYMRLNRRSNKDDLFLTIAMYNVRKKFNNTCQWYKCGKTSLSIEIHVHHIFPVSEYPELKCIEEYMITYCKEHHAYWHEIRGDYYYNLIRSSNNKD